MKNWETLEPDRYRLLSRNFTPGRTHRIDCVVRHHNAGMLSIDQIWDVWQTREASAHYQVTAAGEIGQLVNDSDTAWHAADAAVNARSIGIEHANIGGAADGWPISDETIREGAKLAGAVLFAYKCGPPRYGHNVLDHRDVFPGTSCPVKLAAGGEYHDRWMAIATDFYNLLARGGNPNGDDDMTPEDRNLLIETRDLCRVIRDQLTGPGGRGGWKQTGGRTLVDLTAAVAESQGIPGAHDTVK